MTVIAKPRTAFAYDIAMLRVGDMGLRAACVRLAALCVITGSAVVGGAHWFAYVIIGFAMLGGLLSVASNGWQVNQGHHPSNPVARWSLRVTVAGSGRMLPDVPGVIEALSYLPLAAIGPWLMQGSSGPTRMLAFAAALAWVASCVNAVFTDPGFYNPDVDRRWRIVDVARRRALWVVLIGAACGVSLPATWTPQDRVIVTGLCVALGFLQLRIRETDRTFLQALRVSSEREIAGRHTMVEAVHEVVGQPTAMLRVLLADHPDLMEALDETVSDLEGGYSDVLSMENDLDQELDWPGRLKHRLRRLTRLYFTDFDLSYPEQLSRIDRMIAHQLLHNLAVNAANAGALECGLDLVREGDMLVVRAIDDGRPVNEAVWLAEGGGMWRTLRRLERAGAGASIRLRCPGGAAGIKLITAQWRAQPKIEETT